MIVLLKSRGHTCPYCGKDHLEIVAELSLSDFEVAKMCGLAIIWTCPECEAENVSHITEGITEFYALKEDKN
jgi:transcription elongation factor Elf1